MSEATPEDRLARARQWGRERLVEIAQLRAQRDAAAALAEARLTLIREKLLPALDSIDRLIDDAEHELSTIESDSKYVLEELLLDLRSAVGDAEDLAKSADGSSSGAANNADAQAVARAGQLETRCRESEATEAFHRTMAHRAAADREASSQREERSGLALMQALTTRGGVGTSA
jgi:hypothetical protein